MTRWAMVADLERCVGCQTCTAVCKHVNATPPAVQWRKVIDLETGVYPQVRRVFVPVGCMHCEDPPCMAVCPSTATGQRPDGIVTIDYDICIGCAYCAVACPYQARFKVDGRSFAYGGDGQMKNEARREDPSRLGVAQKCTFCSGRVDAGLQAGLTPGIDPDATPACVNSCLADALHFGDLDDPGSNVSRLLEGHRTFRMHEELGTGPGFHYIWKRNNSNDDAQDEDMDPVAASGTGDIGAAAPWLQQHWDWRAAGNFIGGGSGGGLLASLAAVGLFSPPPLWLVLAALAFIGGGLFLVWLETGRPWRAPLNVFFNPRTSWMSRESILAMVLFPVAFAAAWWSSQPLLVAAALLALGFVYCQARLLMACKGIPAWREPAIVRLIINTGLCEGAGLLLLIGDLSAAVQAGLGVALLGLLGMRMLSWRSYRDALRAAAPDATKRVIIKMNMPFIVLGHMLPVVLIAAGYWFTGASSYLLALAGAVAMAAGWLVKYQLITKASYNQGYAIVRSPERGDGGGGPGGRPGWSKAR